MNVATRIGLKASAWSTKTTAFANPRLATHHLQLRTFVNGSPCIQMQSKLPAYSTKGQSRSLRILPRRNYSTENPPATKETLPPENKQPAERSNSLLGRILPASLAPGEESSSSLRKLISLAGPEKPTIAKAVGLVRFPVVFGVAETLLTNDTAGARFLLQLFISSAVSMSIPFTIGKLIDFFSSPDPVSAFFFSNL